MPDTVECICCGKVKGISFSEDEMPDWGCANCQQKYPPSLIKACGDFFEYALQLKNGEIYEFHTAKIHGDWVTIKAGIGDHEGFEDKSLPCPRGIDIRISEIVWCADAPHGS